jgi:hypothetical protein
MRLEAYNRSLQNSSPDPLANELVAFRARYFATVIQVLNTIGRQGSLSLMTS